MNYSAAGVGALGAVASSSSAAAALALAALRQSLRSIVFDCCQILSIGHYLSDNNNNNNTVTYDTV